MREREVQELVGLLQEYGRAVAGEDRWQPGSYGVLDDTKSDRLNRLLAMVKRPLTGVILEDVAAFVLNNYGKEVYDKAQAIVNNPDTTRGEAAEELRHFVKTDPEVRPKFLQEVVEQTAWSLVADEIRDPEYDDTE